MPHSFGLRARTRHLFARKFRQKGCLNLTTYLKNIKVGDYVDVVGNGSIQKGMPHKFYHGKTGKVWNVTPRAIGVVVNKLVGHRIMAKKIHVRIEHCRPSKCQADFHARVKRNSAIRAANKGKPEAEREAVPKRQPVGPRKGHTVRVKKTTVTALQPQPHISFYV